MSQIESAAEFKRRRAIELLKEGEPTSAIARFLGVAPNSICQWQRLYQAGESLRSKPLSGRPRRLSREEVLQLEQTLLMGAVASGWVNEMWTTHRVKDVIWRQFNKRVSRATAWRILTKTLRWSPQLPTKKLVERDEREIDRWRSEEFNRIKRQTFERRAYLLFVDEAGFMLMPSVRKTFAPIGQTPIAQVCEPHGRISTSCAIAFSPIRRASALIYRMLPDNSNFTGQSVCDFLQQVMDRVRNPMTIVWDSIPIHYAQPVRDFVRKHRRVHLEMFPKYAPELNPADGVWAYVKYARLANYTPQSMVQLRSQVQTELDRLAQRPDLLTGFLRKTPLRLD